MATATKTKRNDGSDRYIELVKEFQLRPIRDDQTHQQAKRMLRSLHADGGSSVNDYKTVLVTLIADYERKAGYQIDASHVSGADVVRHLLEERGMSINAFAKAIGMSQGSLSDILNGKREWSKSAIVKVADYFGLRTDIFLR